MCRNLSIKKMCLQKGFESFEVLALVELVESEVRKFDLFGCGQKPMVINKNFESQKKVEMGFGQKLRIIDKSIMVNCIFIVPK